MELIVQAALSQERNHILELIRRQLDDLASIMEMQEVTSLQRLVSFLTWRPAKQEIIF